MIAGCRMSVAKLLHCTASLFYTLCSPTYVRTSADELAMHVALCQDRQGHKTYALTVE